MGTTITERYAEARAKAAEIHNSAESEGRKLTDDERTEFTNALAEAKELKAQVDQVVADRQALADLGDLAALDDIDPTGPKGAHLDGATPGERFVNSELFQSAKAAYGDKFPADGHISMAGVDIGNVFNALLTDPGFQNPAIRITDAPYPVLDLLSAITVIDDAPLAIKTFTGTFTNAADVVDEGDAKPEATYVWTSDTVSLETVAHTIPMTEQAINHNPTLVSRVNTAMVGGVRAKLQAMVAAYLAASTGVQTQAYDTDLRTTLRKAVTKAQVAADTYGAGPTSILLNTADAESLDLEQISSVVLSPGEMPQQGTNIWRSPLVVTSAVPSGYAYVGDLRQIELYTAGGIDVAFGWVNNQFRENERTMRAETEGAVSAMFAGALVEADLTAA